MVPFSWNETMLRSRVMNNYTSLSATVEVWTPEGWVFSGARRLEFGAFALSCFRAFLILILAPVFHAYSVPVAIPLRAHPWFTKEKNKND